MHDARTVMTLVETRHMSPVEPVTVWHVAGSCVVHDARTLVETQHMTLVAG